MVIPWVLVIGHTIEPEMGPTGFTSLLLTLNLISTRDIIVFLDIELANWTSGSSLEQPLVNAFLMESMQTWHRSQIDIDLVVDKAHHTF